MPLHARSSLGIAFNYASQLYGALLGICVLPLYRRYMGDEGYGIASFFTLVQSYAQLFDFGISATMLRTMARARGASVSQQYAAQVFRSLRTVAWIVALFITLALLLLARAIGVGWLNAAHLPLREVTLAIAFMAPLVGIRWLSAFYRAVLLGAGSQGTLATVNVVVSTIRYLGVVPIIAFRPQPVVEFALFQLVVSIAEFVVLLVLCRRLMGPAGAPSVDPIPGNRHYLIFIGLTAAISTGVTQTDKLLLSGMTSLEDYGSSMLAISLAGVITLLATPVGQALQPRLTTLIAQGRSSDAVELYRKASKVLWHVVAPAGLTLATFAGDALLFWTGDAKLAMTTAPVLALYALGNCVMVIAGMPYILLTAKGRPALDTLGMSIVCIALIPTMYLACLKSGALGTGVVWFAAMCLYLLLWSPIMHSAHARGLHAKWLRDVATTAAACTVVAVLASRYLPLATSRAEALFRISVGGILVSLASFLCSNYLCRLLKPLLKRKKTDARNCTN